MRYILFLCIIFTVMVTCVALIASASNNSTVTSENLVITETAKKDCHISKSYAMGDPLASCSEGAGRTGRGEASPVRNSLK